MFDGVVAKRPNKTILLYRGTLELQNTKETVRGKGTVYLRWLPTPAIEFRLGRGPAQRAFWMAGTLWIRVPEHGWRGRGFTTYVSPSRGLTGTFCLGISGSLRKGRRLRLREVAFHVPNMDRRGKDVVRDATGGWLGRTVLQAAGWELTIDRLRNVDKVLDAATREGGYVVTHVGIAKRSDARTFAPRDVVGLTRPLALFLSFAGCAWTAPILLVGFDRKGDRVWEEWLPRQVSTRRGGDPGWASDRVDLACVFPGFWNLMTDPVLGTALGSIVHWYVEANRQAGALDGALVLLQCAFELLAWMELVMRRSAMKPAQFDKLPAKAALTALLSALGIPISIPRSLPNLKRRAKALGGVDGPATLTSIRNRIVHPPKTKKPHEHHDVALLEEAWRYSLWLTELCVLAMVGYRGPYRDRLRHRYTPMKTATVPWA